MNHRDARDVRNALNELDSVAHPEADRTCDRAFQFALVHQPGYANGEPHYDVLR